MGVLCTWVKLLTDMQISGCGLHKNAFGGRALHGPAGGAIDPLAVTRGDEGGKGKQRVRNREGE